MFFTALIQLFDALVTPCESLAELGSWTAVLVKGYVNLERQGVDESVDETHVRVTPTLAPSGWLIAYIYNHESQLDPIDMRFVEQPGGGIEIVGVGEVERSEKRHGPLLPDSIRGVLCGPSNCGKTQALISLLLSKNGLRFQNVYVYSKSLTQPKYVYLEKLFQGIPEIGYQAFSNNEEILPPDQVGESSIMVFDDIACEKQAVVRKYFCMGRHFDVDSFYLCQSYAQIPKHLIRDNLNLLILFQQDGLNLRNIYNSHVNGDMNFDTFQTMCRRCWEERYGFLLINKDAAVRGGRYRKGYNTFILPDRGQSF